MLNLSARVNSLLAVAVVSAVPVGLASCGFCGPSKCCGSKQEQVVGSCCGANKGSCGASQ